MTAIILLAIFPAIPIIVANIVGGIADKAIVEPAVKCKTAERIFSILDIFVGIILWFLCNLPSIIRVLIIIVHYYILVVVPSILIYLIIEGIQGGLDNEVDDKNVLISIIPAIAWAIVGTAYLYCRYGVLKKNKE